MGSYIKIDRKILEWEWYKNQHTKTVFLHCLLKAYWKDTKFEGKIIPRGSFVTSVKRLSEELDLTADEIKTALKHLTKTGELTKQATNKFTVITVSNYDSYQEVTKQMPNEYQSDAEQMQNNSTPIAKLLPTYEEYKELEELKEPEEEKKERKENLTVSNETVCRTDVQRILDAWNDLQKFGIKPVTRVSGGSKRYNSLVARMKQYSTEQILGAIRKITESDYLQGKNKHGWAITFDWFVLPNNFPKVLEGNYDNRTRTADCGFKDSSKEIQFDKLMEQIRRDEENANRGC